MRIGAEKQNAWRLNVIRWGYKRLYIQSAFSIPDDEKREQELQSLRRIDDSFQKIVIVGDHSPRYQNEDGILFMDIYDFLMDGDSLIDWVQDIEWD